MQWSVMCYRNVPGLLIRGKHKKTDLKGTTEQQLRHISKSNISAAGDLAQSGSSPFHQSGRSMVKLYCLADEAWQTIIILEVLHDEDLYIPVQGGCFNSLVTW